MRIDENRSSLPIDSKKVLDGNTVKAQGTEFQKLVQQQGNKLTEERLNEILAKMDRAGERLTQSRTVRDLMEYKNLVKSFVKEATSNGLGLEDRHGFNSRGRPKQYRMLSEIDTKLVDLTNAVLKKETPMIQLLNQMGEIRGMLINFAL